MKYKLLIESETPIKDEELTPLLKNGRHVRLIPIDTRVEVRHIKVGRPKGAKTNPWKTKEEDFIKQRWHKRECTIRWLSEQMEGRSFAAIKSHIATMIRQGRLKRKNTKRRV